MTWDVEYVEELEEWWDLLSEAEQESIDASVQLLERYGPQLQHPHSSDVKSSKHGNMRELRIQHEGRPYRILYAFDPRRTAILLLGGDKTGDNRWYDSNVPKADSLYSAHLATLKNEGAI